MKKNSHLQKKEAGMRLFILDCSVILAWIFNDEKNAYADMVEDAFAVQSSAVVPMIFFLELANALVMGERRKRVTNDEIRRVIRLLPAFPLVTDELAVATSLTTTVSLARQHNLTAYDAAYLELALRRGLPLATLDTKLQVAATAAGVTLYEP